MWSDMGTAFRGYMGSGMIVICYLLAIVYLWRREERRYLRILFLYIPLAVLALFFNPLFAKFVYRMAEAEIYWRMLWLLPMTATLAYACVRVYGQLHREKGKRPAEAAALCMAGIIAVSGSFIYASPSFSRAENLYHVPDVVVAICEAIHVPGREVMAAFPPELTQYVRQYSPLVCMPYGREISVDGWHNYHPLREEMRLEVVDLEKVVPLSRENLCHYVIFGPDQKIQGKPEDYGWVRFGEMEGYVIYRDPEIELSIPELD